MERGPGRGRRGPRTRWRALEIAAVVLGFIIWWPVGLALLLWKVWRAKNGRPSDLVDAARSFEENVMHNWPEKARRWGCAGKRRAEGAMPDGWGFSAGARSTGNAAFDEWRDAELSRLDEERRKLEDAAREFADYVESLRKAKDREEFDRFMRQRGASRPADGPQAG
ncbi:MAG: DUF2852 domain-containing protein [Beijerinckiaceae bacterium]